jgi:hypothetical protein
VLRRALRLAAVHGDRRRGCGLPGQRQWGQLPGEWRHDRLQVGSPVFFSQNLLDKFLQNICSYLFRIFLKFFIQKFAQKSFSQSFVLSFTIFSAKSIP